MLLRLIFALFSIVSASIGESDAAIEMPWICRLSSIRRSLNSVRVRLNDTPRAPLEPRMELSFTLAWAMVDCSAAEEVVLVTVTPSSVLFASVKAETFVLRNAHWCG